MSVDNMSIGEVKEVLNLLKSLEGQGDCKKCDASGIDSFAIGEIVIIRTYSAGVWCGRLEKKAGNEVILKNARRMWSWKAKRSISLSGVAAYGIDHAKSKIAPPVDRVWLEAIEIIPLDEEIAKNIMEAPIVEAE